MLFRGHSAGEASRSWLWALGCVPFLCQVAAGACVGGEVVGVGEAPAEPQEANWKRLSRGLLGFLGISLFATVTALGFLVYLAGERMFAGQISPALGHVALLVALAAWPVLSIGLSVHQNLADISAAP